MMGERVKHFPRFSGTTIICSCGKKFYGETLEESAESWHQHRKPSE